MCDCVEPQMLQVSVIVDHLVFSSLYRLAVFLQSSILSFPGCIASILCLSIPSGYVVADSTKQMTSVVGYHWQVSISLHGWGLHKEQSFLWDM